MVSGSAPSATPSRVVSASPRVMIEALVLSPKPMPSAIPTASAMTFFTAPPSLTPTTSTLVYGRKYGARPRLRPVRRPAGRRRQPRWRSAGWAAISAARLGPETTATLRPACPALGHHLAHPLPWSAVRPLHQADHGTSPGTAGAPVRRLLRSVCDGRARTTSSAPSSDRLRFLAGRHRGPAARHPAGTRAFTRMSLMASHSEGPAPTGRRRGLRRRAAWRTRCPRTQRP